MTLKSKIAALSLGIISLTFGIQSCSTEKDAAVNRFYHGLNAHYNGYFNANELLRQSMITYRSSRIEDYYELLPIDPMPDENEVLGMYPAIDTAIVKCKKVIQKHSMPSNDKPSLKKAEYNKWIDENWTTIGIASYYRRDYDGALKSFNYVKKFYSNDPSLFVGELWMAKTYIAKNNLVKAKEHLDNLDKAIVEEEGRTKADWKLEDGKKMAEFPKKIKFQLELTKADLALLREEKELAVNALENAIKYARAGDDKERVHFILGQLYAERNDDLLAEKHYSAVIRGKARYDMSFNARLQRAFLGSGDKVRKELNKMLRDSKNAEFKDQIYYALAQLEFREKDQPKGMEYLTLSAFYSTKNMRQKGMAYEQLGDIHFADRNYVRAQKYYDSCATVIPENYPNGEAIKNKASNLANLVVAVETSYYEDSVQRIAAMDESSRETFLKALIKKMKEEEEERRRRDAEKLRELQKNENLFVQDDKGGKWYWTNAKTRAQGYEEFKRLWGGRENEDNWRRADKAMVIRDIKEDPDNPIDTIAPVPSDTLTVEYLSSKLPLNDSLLALSNARLMAARYSAGIIYKEQLAENKLAENEFKKALEKNLKEDPHDLMSAFQLYKMYETGDVALAGTQKDYILNNYPNSDYANYLRDPNFFVKKKELDALAEDEYVRVLDRYNRGLYYPVLTKANEVILNEPDNRFRAKYYLLKALCQGQLNENKQEMVPVLEELIAQYPETMESERAQELLNIIKNGYSKNDPYDFEKTSIFAYTDNLPFRVLVFLDEKETSNAARTKIADFNREFFSREKLKVSSKIFGTDQSVVLVDEFPDEMSAAKYIRVFKQTRKYLLDLQNAKIYMITNENLKILFKDQNLSEFETFYEEYF
jgi:hypothetical protein